VGIVDDVNAALDDRKKYAVCQIAPSVRVSIGEEFGFAPGAIVTKKLIGALKNAGFRKVLDTSSAADIVTVEEGTELLGRLADREQLPLLTSCCSASVLFIENSYPNYLPHFCSVKSPQQSMGALIKTHYARRMRLQRKNIYCVSIMPCVVKKLEAKRPEMEFNGVPHTDAVLTTREAAQLLKLRGIDLKSARGQEFDQILGKGSGAGQLFGTTGGVTEALLRFVSWKLEGKGARTEFKEVRGEEGFREAKVAIAGKPIRIAIVDGLTNLRDLLTNREKFYNYDVIEIMSCPGGCIGGAGQPASTKEKLSARRKALFEIDSKEKARMAMQNEAVKCIYKNYLIEPNSQVSESVLHLKRICLKCD